MDINLVGFDVFLGKQKPENLVNEAAPCPFCDRENLKDIIDTEGDIILLKNKYNVIQNAEQYVIIESSFCKRDMPDYTQEHMRKLINFSIKHYQNFIDSNKYEAVLFFKNFGKMSGGTIAHPHMQIVNFPKLNKKLLFNKREFEGIMITEQNGVLFNVSNCPRIGFGELNLIANKLNFSINTLADFIQISVKYLTDNFNKRGKSYNIFFYYDDKNYYVKIMPRFATSPLFIGYNIRFLPNNISLIAKEIKETYFN